MSDIHVHPGRLRGKVIPPPSKSDAHRALIAAALAGDMQNIQGLPPDFSQDLAATKGCMNTLLTGGEVLNCNESGTTLRFMVPLAAALGKAVTFKGKGQLPKRPLAEYVSILSGHGITLDLPKTGSLPLSISGHMRGGDFYVPGHISSQYISGLLMALPLLKGDSRVILSTPLESAPYVDMTRKTLNSFGIIVHDRDYGYYVPGRQSYRPCRYEVEKDYSQAAFWLVAAYAGSDIEVAGLNPDSVQGDKAIYPLLAAFAAGKEKYTIDVAQIPDLVPALTVAATLTSARTVITNARRLRIKESDRLEAICSSLGEIGADIVQTEDGLEILGGRLSRKNNLLTGGTADSFADHRIAMALAIAALSTRDGVLIRRAEAINKSYPDFFSDLQHLGGKIDEFNMGK